MSIKTIKKNKKPTKKLKENEEEPILNIRLSDVGVVKRSPSEQELNIQADRILSVVDRVITKTKAAVCFQMLLEDNSRILRDNLAPEEFDLVCYVLTKQSKSVIIKKCSYKRSNISQEIFSTFEKINLTEMQGYEMEMFNNPSMLKVFEIVWQNQELNKFLLNKFKQLNNESSIKFIDSIKNFRKLMCSKLAESGIEKIKRERALRKAWRFNANIHEEISKAENEFEIQKTSFENVVRTKTNLVINFQKVIDALNLSFRNEVKVICMNSENEMMADSRTSEPRQVDLSEEAKNAQQQYEALLSKNLRHEKVLRARRLKIETQLTSWLTKFDSDIGDRQAEFDLIAKNFQEEKYELINLTKRFDEQEIDYNILMAEKQEQDFKVWAEVAMLFLKNRSARIIQRAWKAYKERKIALLLKKKAQAKARAAKKAAAEAAKKK